MDPKLLTMAAEHAMAVYWPEKHCHNKCKAMGLRDFEFHDDGVAQAYVASDDEKIIVAFRGTEPDKLMDIIADLKVKKVSTTFGGKVHHGFNEYMQRLGLDLCGSIHYLLEEKPKKKVYLFGHSLGAAASILFASHFFSYRYGLSNNDLEYIVLFGCPNVGDKAFSRLFNGKFGKKTYTVVNNNDVVSRIPVALPDFIYWALRMVNSRLPLVPGGYRPVGLNTVYFDFAGRQHENPGWKFRLCDRIGGRLEDFGKLGTDGVKDHSMKRYLALTKRGRLA